MLELVDLVAGLMRDPSSRLQAAIAGWDRPTSMEWVVLADLFDLQHSSKSKHRPKLYPRPWPDNKNKIGGKKTVKRSIRDVLSILRPGKTE